jgi:hypothetical protein
MGPVDSTCLPVALYLPCPCRAYGFPVTLAKCSLFWVDGRVTKGGDGLRRFFVDVCLCIHLQAPAESLGLQLHGQGLVLSLIQGDSNLAHCSLPQLTLGVGFCFMFILSSFKLDTCLVLCRLGTPWEMVLALFWTSCQ